MHTLAMSIDGLFSYLSTNHRDAVTCLIILLAMVGVAAIVTTTVILITKGE